MVDQTEFSFLTLFHPQNKDGAHKRDRTADLVLTKDVLYRLSYVGTQFRIIEQPLSFMKMIA